MTTAFLKRRLSLGVAWRLTVGLLPSVVAVALVIGLYYYGEIGRGAPRFLLTLATMLTVLAVGITWANARYFAARISRLARVSNTAGEKGQEDEFERIEHIVDSLGTALTASEAERARADAIAGEQRRDEATMIAGVVADTLARLDDVRLPLHILLEAPFGELNENQEELLRDARAASDTMDSALRRLAQVADADRGALALQTELVQVNDVVRSVLPLARAAAERRGARIASSLEPGMPRVMADRARLAEALALLTSGAADSLSEHVALSITTERAAGVAIIRLSPLPARSIVAERLIEAQGGAMSTKDGALEVRIGQGSRVIPRSESDEGSLSGEGS